MISKKRLKELHELIYSDELVTCEECIILEKDSNCAACVYKKVANKSFPTGATGAKLTLKHKGNRCRGCPLTENCCPYYLRRRSSFEMLDGYVDGYADLTKDELIYHVTHIREAWVE
jgi:hypothetical protein